MIADGNAAYHLVARFELNTKSPVHHLKLSPLRGDGGFLYKLGGFSYTIRILMYPACILHVSCMYSDVSRSNTSRYIKIHRDTTRYSFVSVTLAIKENVSYLGTYVSFFTIHSGYI